MDAARDRRPATGYDGVSAGSASDRYKHRGLLSPCPCSCGCTVWVGRKPSSDRVARAFMTGFSTATNGLRAAHREWNRRHASTIASSRSGS